MLLFNSQSENRPLIVVLETVGIKNKKISQYKESAREVDIGKTIFHDTAHGFAGTAMKIAYIVTHPRAALVDAVIALLE